MMRIVIDLTSLADNFSGMERFALSIAKELVKNKNDKFILLFKNSINNEFKNCGKNVQKIIIKGNRNKLIFYQVLLPYALLKITADFYFFPAFPAPFFFFKSGSVSTIHDVSCWDCPETNKKHMVAYFRLLFWKAARNNKRIITVSEFSKKRIMNLLRVKEDNILVVNPSIAEGVQYFRYDERENQNVKEKYGLPEKYILCLSTLEPRKNLELLIHAYVELVQEKRLNCDLVLAGRKGWLIDNLLVTVETNVADKIRFTGFIDERDLPYVYSDSLLFVFPSLYEGFGVPPLEAMSVGTVTISSDAASLPEILKDGAIFFRSNDINDLKNKILKATKMSPEERMTAIEKGKKVARSYSWKESAIKLKNSLIKWGEPF